MKYLVKQANLTGIVNFLNERYKKKGGGIFSPRDVLGYIDRGKLPDYLGGNKIVEVEQENCSVRLYNIEMK